MSRLTIELDDHRMRVLEKVARKERVSKTAILERLVDRLEAPDPMTAGDRDEEGADAPIQTMQEWLAKYAGCAKGLPPDYASNPKYLKYLGTD
jgi:predicted transcriptional regulator